MSVMRRSLTPPSIDAAEQQLDRAQQQRALGRAAASACRSARPRRSPRSSSSGTCACALAHVSWRGGRCTSSSSGTRSSADRRVDAVRQNASSVRSRRRSCSDVNLVGRVKSTARMRRRRCGARRLLGQPALARGVDERGDRVRAQDLAAARSMPHGLHRTRAATVGVLAAGLAHGHGARRDVDADRAAAVAAGLGRRRTGIRSAGELVAHGGLVALRRPRGVELDDGEHARAADQHGLEQRPAARRAPTTRSISSGTAWSANLHGSPAPRARRLRAARRAPARRCRAGGPAAPGRCTSPGRGDRARRRRRPRRRAHPSAPSSPPSSTGPRRASSCSTPPVVGHEQERDRAVLALDDEVGVEQQRDVAARSARSASTVSTIAPSMSVAVAGGRRLDLHAGHRAERVDVGACRRCCRSRISAETPNSVVGLDAQHAGTSASASSGVNEQQHGRRHVADDAEHDAR